jgi:phytoene dehydrogenase-like protein
LVTVLKLAFYRSRSIVPPEEIPPRMSSGQVPWEAVVVGAGHNGLTAAAYLARAGLRTLVLERREIVGGCCVTEEIHPGCRASTTSYIASMLRPEVIHELALASHVREMALVLGKREAEARPWRLDYSKPMSAYEYYEHKQS